MAFRKGEEVTLTGLKTASLNGLIGVVHEDAPAESPRISVRMPDHLLPAGMKEILAVKPANLQRDAATAEMIQSKIKVTLPQGFDPDTLPPWVGELQLMYKSRLSIRDLFTLTQTDSAEPLAEARKTTILLATMFDEHGPNFGLAVQNPDESRGILVLAMRARQIPDNEDVQAKPAESTSDSTSESSSESKLRHTGLLEVQWHFGEKATLQPKDLQAMNALLGRVKKENPVGGHTVSDSGLDALQDMLVKNRARLADGYKARHDDAAHPGIKCSVIPPMETTLINLHHCAVCSTLPEKPKWCGGCLKVPYCSAACQKKHWKEGGHKAECTKTKKGGSGGDKGGSKKGTGSTATAGGAAAAAPRSDDKLLVVDLTKQDSMGVGNNYGMFLSTNTTTSGRQNKPQKVSDRAKIPANLRGTETVVKVQVQPVADMCLIYDRTRSWEVHCDRGNCVAGLAEIARLVRTRGVMGGKGYFRAWLPKTPNGLLKISYADMLPPRNW
eukprot:m.185314 g.185314  ORF g.185314 m.185314 type:complete len:499 (-) comp15025_c0_seq1:161-1657(-)